MTWKFVCIGIRRCGMEVCAMGIGTCGVRAMWYGSLCVLEWEHVVWKCVLEWGRVVWKFVCIGMGTCGMEVCVYWNDNDNNNSNGSHSIRAIDHAPR